ncbi:MAG: thioredoxin [Armatimonadetes bacterium]|nr:thioredoxin [Armatimonadota bacterium]
MTQILEITDDNFEAEVLKSELPVLIDFWAPWCAPCRRIAPIVEQLATDLQGRLKVAKCNIDQTHGVPGRYGIFSIPTLLLMVKGDVKEQIVGAQSRQAIEAKITPHLGG